jgi:phage repressor protein C with HTH and peptisase S24 domain
MLSHATIWAAIDALAERNGLSPSGLAKKSGLDATSFNKSKRITQQGRARWPSTESIAKALKATQTGLDEFLSFISSEGSEGFSGNFRHGSAHIPVIGFAQAGVGGFFDDGGFPLGQGWDEIRFPVGEHEMVYALQVAGDSMAPIYRDGDLILVAPSAPVRKGDRVVVKTCGGEVMAKVLAKRASSRIELASLNPKHPERHLQVTEVEWIARILWASQ